MQATTIDTTASNSKYEVGEIVVMISIELQNKYR